MPQEPEIYEPIRPVDLAGVFLPVLMYHSVDRVATDYVTVSTEVFEHQLRYLADRYRVMSVVDAYTYLAGGDRAAVENAVALTFDDGLEDNYRYAAPLLEKLDISATFFVIAGVIGEDNRWNRRAFRIMRHMDVAQLADLASRGFDVQSHGLTHHRLSKLTPAEIAFELSEASRIIEETTATRPIAVSYPYGDASASCLKIAARYYACGFAATKQGCFDWGRNPMDVRRIFVSPNDEPDDLDRKIDCYGRGIQHE